MRALFTALAALTIVAPLSALSFDYTFIVTPPGPAGTVTGSFSGTFVPGPGITASSLSGANVTINGFAHTAANTLLEVSNSTASGQGLFKLGGQLNGINSLTTNTNDFLVILQDRGDLGVRPVTFGYTTAGFPGGFWNTPNFIVFRTPDTGHAALLFSSAMIGLIALRRKKSALLEG